MGVHSRDDVAYSMGYSRRAHPKHNSEASGQDVRRCMRRNDQSGNTFSSFHNGRHHTGRINCLFLLAYAHKGQKRQIPNTRSSAKRLSQQISGGVPAREEQT